MAVSMACGKGVKLTDRSVPQILKASPQAVRFEIICFMRLMAKLGVDYFEADHLFVNGDTRIPHDLRLIYRINSPADSYCLKKEAVMGCVVEERIFSAELLNQIKSFGKFIILEHAYRGENDLYGFLEKKETASADVLRITGIDRNLSREEITALEAVTGPTGQGLDICPSNRLFMASSIAVDSVFSIFDSVTASFGGIGSKHGFAALEEVLAALLIYSNQFGSVSLDVLPALADLYERLTGTKFHEKKPVIGKSIFLYESGIHADGIRKNPATYEPFAPEWVGLKRELILGKHSGSMSVIQKLNEMGISLDHASCRALLEEVRDLSIRYGRSLDSCELSAICFKKFGKPEVFQKCTV